MKNSRRPVQRDYGSLFLGGILLGIVTVVFGIMLAFTQARGQTPRFNGIGDESSRLKRSSSLSMNGPQIIFGSMERNCIG